MRIIFMRTSYSILTSVFLLVSFTSPQLATAQTRAVSPQEYIQSASPLPGGGRVVSRTTPGGGVQTIATIATLPSVADRNSTAAPGYQPKQFAGGVPIYSARPFVGATASGSSSTANTNANSSLNPSGNASPNSAAAVYPYPAAVPPTGSNVTAFRQSNTLGLNQSGNPAARLAQNCATCTPPTNYAPTTAYQPPSYQQQPPAAFQAPPFGSQVPDLSIQMPGQPAQPNYGQPDQYQLPGTFGTPQYGAQGANWWTPFVSGSGVYTPLVKFQNMPPGTYLGQGVIGQPTAYVDGQPVRNLLRFVSP